MKSPFGQNDTMTLVQNDTTNTNDYTMNTNNVAAADDENVKMDLKDKLQEEFVCCIGSTNLNAILECLSYLDDLPFEVIQIALKKTADVNGNWKYAKAILNKWVKEKIDTVEKVKTEELNFKKGKQPTEETEEEKKERMIKELEVEFGNGN